jgi:ASPIC and UnbV/FG-GAP-like repeat
MYRGRINLDASGFGALTATIEPWDPNASFQTVAELWSGAAPKAISRLDVQCEAARRDGDAARVCSVLVFKAMLLCSEGEPKRAYEALEEARILCNDDQELAHDWLYTVTYFQGIAAMRGREDQSAMVRSGSNCCVLPISALGIHSSSAGSRLAIRHFREYLRQFPDDLAVRWLLNLAHMNLGEYPAKVEPQYLVSLTRFAGSEFHVGRFREVGSLVGINRIKQGGGAILEDFDNDGFLDFTSTSSSPTEPMAYYHNRGDGSFEDLSKAAGLDGQLGGSVCYQTDYNNDGHIDIFVARGAGLPFGARPSLLCNDGHGKFTDVTAAAGLMEPANSNAASWADYDNDGWLDLFLGCERQPNRLYRNRRDGTFEEIAAQAGLHDIPQIQCCKGTAWLDIDNDDYPDLFLNNAGGTGVLYRNNRNGTFTNVTRLMGIDCPYRGFSCWAWDYDNDGWLDIFATCHDHTLDDIVKGLSGIPHGMNSNRLYRNLRGKRFDDRTREAGLNTAFGAMGSNYGDFDNDGFLDMYLGSGVPSVSGVIPNRMFKNVEGNRLAEITADAGTGLLGQGHGVACGDWDRDGDNDVFLSGGGAVKGDRYRELLFLNPGAGNHWLTLKLIGSETNRAAIGTRIKIVTAGANPLTIHRHVSSGSSFGANPLQQTIGLAESKQAAVVEIHWPTSGTTQVFHDVAADQAIEVTELAGSYRRLNWKALPQPECGQPLESGGGRPHVRRPIRNELDRTTGQPRAVKEPQS